MLDPHIRAALMDRLASADPEAVVFHELPLSRGDRRADVVAVNGVIAGFEIKSERDSLARLTGQADRYDDVCEYMTVVVARRHLPHARATVPRRWGIVVAEPDLYGIRLRDVRKPRRNGRLDKRALVRLMWRTECARALRNVGRRLPPRTLALHLWAELDKLPMATVLREVRAALKRRAGESSGRT
ncbi:MAG TPA: sce7726 family protein [Tepidisphaeraceae bacterium]|nr:sce7726 family protein [Tepidisphaeraceae bacterium]